MIVCILGDWLALFFGVDEATLEGIQVGRDDELRSLLT